MMYGALVNAGNVLIGMQCVHIIYGASGQVPK